jgi:hypothetical protein
MGLQSSLFAGDARIEAIAVSDAMNVKEPDRGPHVAKIQLALNTIEGAGLTPDGAYGPRTAAAVLAFKRKRRIINTAYQQTADAIVGKMTIAALDAELAAIETPAGPIRVRVLHPTPDPDEVRATGTATGGVRLAFALPASVLASVGGPRTPKILPGEVVLIDRGKTALIEISNATGATVTNKDPGFVSVRDPATRAPVTRIERDPQSVEVLGLHRGGALIAVTRPFPPSSNVNPRDFIATVTVSVKENRPTPYTPTMVPHDHRPTGRWRELLSQIEQPTDTSAGKALFALCATGAEPITFVNAAKMSEFRDKPIALRHLDWYLRDGRGQDFDEDEIIAGWVKADGGLRRKVVGIIARNTAFRTGFSDFFSFDQTEYESQDHRFAFGTLDRIDIDVDWTARTVKLWFKDSYEWHPVCPGFYHKHPDDVVRETNSLHAALVELKSQGAADFWMIGEATLPMSAFGLLP